MQLEGEMSAGAKKSKNARRRARPTFREFVPGSGPSGSSGVRTPSSCNAYRRPALLHIPLHTFVPHSVKRNVEHGTQPGPVWTQGELQHHVPLFVPLSGHVMLKPEGSCRSQRTQGGMWTNIHPPRTMPKERNPDHVKRKTSEPEDSSKVGVFGINKKETKNGKK